MNKSVYAIGKVGQAWGDLEKSSWYKQQTIKRSYANEVVSKLNRLTHAFNMKQYGSLDIDKDRYPLYALLSKDWAQDKKSVLITGGVHGYETSGVQGAIHFLGTSAKDYYEQFNLVVIPCVSPWAYETINRWNNHAIDPNRSFCNNSLAQESLLLMKFIKELGVDFSMHIDLHETTESDNAEFRPALAARDAVQHTNWNIPDGFYLVADSLKPETDFQSHIIEKVAQVTHIAQADTEGKLIGVAIEQHGVINYEAKMLGLCMGLTDAPYVTTTEVYPDSPLVDAQICIKAQVAAISAAMNYLK